MDNLPFQINADDPDHVLRERCLAYVLKDTSTTYIYLYSDAEYLFEYIKHGTVPECRRHTISEMETK